MAALLSPGIKTREFDFSLVVPNLSATESGLAGGFLWGPVEEPMLIDSEEELVQTFWKPNNTVANDWFTASQYLSYADKLWLVRMVDDNAANTTLRAANASANTAFLVKNDEQYDINYNDGSLKLSYNTGDWIAKFAGALGNNLRVATCTSAAEYSSNLTGTVAVAANSFTVTGTGTAFTTEAQVGDYIVINNETNKISAIANTTSLTLVTRHVAGATANTASRRWEYFFEVDTAPGTSQYVSDQGGSNDEMHVVVIDRTGIITGTPDSVLETYQYLSKASDALTLNGEGNYYKNVLNTKSDWVRWAGHPSLSNIGSPAKGLTFGGGTLPKKFDLQNGRDGQAITNNEKIVGYDFFKDVEELDISFILGSDADSTLAVYIINNILEKRQDCVGFFSPPRAYVVNNKGHEATDCVVFRNTLPSTSYAALDANWKYMYDRYNDVYRYVPMNGDTAGINVRTTEERDAWWPAAGFNRGNVKNVVKLAWNPKQADRDILYKNGINPYVIFKNEGPVLFGQKTLQAKPSSFDRINVRRLFIVMRKAIARSARYFLFEFNDEITRRQFRNLVEPYLRDIKGRRGITSFAVKCDETNNPPTVVERNEFVGSIAVRPNYSAEFITLNFASVSGNISFEEAFSQIS
jgi:hypothetical protein